MMWLKGCPKCRGDMHFDPLADEYVCLQCGLAKDRPPGSPPGPAQETRIAAGLAALRLGNPKTP
jgi:hypothetical protein